MEEHYECSDCNQGFAPTGLMVFVGGVGLLLGIAFITVLFVAYTYRKDLKQKIDAFNKSRKRRRL
jgi:hypothetical protein